VHTLRSVDNLFVVVEEYDNYQFKDSKDETLEDLQKLASKLPWTNALKVWKLNTSLKKKRGPHRRSQWEKTEAKPTKPLWRGTPWRLSPRRQRSWSLRHLLQARAWGRGEAGSPDLENSPQNAQQTVEGQEPEGQEPRAKVLKLCVTCSRAGDKHSFSPNETTRDFGGAVQDFFQWKADMIKFDIEGKHNITLQPVLLNINNVEVVIGIALAEESPQKKHHPLWTHHAALHPVLWHAQPLNGSTRFYLAGDNHDMAVSRTVNNICHIQKKRQGQWDLCHLPMRTSSVDIIITDMPFGKR
ncbi:unnamed protein product, partial [Coregonus sp. 'balchen']